jgi:hypothetical protein
MSATMIKEKQLLLLTVVVAQINEVRAATTEKRKLLLEVQGYS